MHSNRPVHCLSHRMAQITDAGIPMARMACYEVAPVIVQNPVAGRAIVSVCPVVAVTIRRNGQGRFLG
jgi:hypothetical protein